LNKRKPDIILERKEINFMKRTEQKILSILLMLMLVLSMFPLAGFANATVKATQSTNAYDVWANGERFSSDNLTVACGDGTATYDPDTSTLTLTNATISTGCAIPAELAKTYCTSGIFTLVDLNVVLVGDNVIKDTGGTGIDAYAMDDSWQYFITDISMSGSGNLTITETNQSDGYGIYATGALTIDDVTLNINCAATGLWARTDLSITDSEIVINNLVANYFGVVLNAGNAIIDNSVLIGNKQPINGNFFYENNYTLTNDSMIITYNANATPFTEGTNNSIISDPTDIAVWAIQDDVPGIIYTKNSYSGFIAVDVNIKHLAPIFISVTDITGVPTTATAGTSLNLTGTVEPADATNKTITWSIANAGTTGATISGNTLSTTAAGNVIVTATITNGAIAIDYTKDFNITVNAAPQLTVTGMQKEISQNEMPLHISTSTNFTGTEPVYVFYSISQNSGAISSGRARIGAGFDINELSPGVYTLNVSAYAADETLYTPIQVDGYDLFNAGSQNFIFTVTARNNPNPQLISGRITPTTAIFDKYAQNVNYKDISVTLNPGDYTLTAIKNGEYTLIAGTDYIESGNSYTIEKEYLSTLVVGTQNLTFAMSGGIDPILTFTIGNSTPGGNDSDNGNNVGTTQPSEQNPTTPTVPGKVGVEYGKIKSDITLMGRIPQTGDNDNLTLWFSLCGLSLIGMGLILFRMAKKRQGDERQGDV
jgi:hypothetical protein